MLVTQFYHLFKFRAKGPYKQADIMFPFMLRNYYDSKCANNKFNSKVLTHEKSFEEFESSSPAKNKVNKTIEVRREDPYSEKFKGTDFNKVNYLLEGKKNTYYDAMWVNGLRGKRMKAKDFSTTLKNVYSFKA
jgi:hypothetical protein